MTLKMGVPGALARRRDALPVPWREPPFDRQRMSVQDGQTTTKKELVNRIAERTGQTKVVVKEVLQMFLDEIVEELALGKRLEFRDFGVFEVKERQPRQAQNPRTLEKVAVPARRVVKFKVGRRMRRLVCNQSAPSEPRASAGDTPARDGSPPTRPARPSNNSPF